MSTNALPSLQQLASRCSFEQMSDQAIAKLIERYPDLPNIIQDTMPQNDCSAFVNAAIKYDSPIRMRITMTHPYFPACRTAVLKRVVTENKQNIVREFTVNEMILPGELGDMLSNASRLGSQGIVHTILTCNRCSEIP